MGKRYLGIDVDGVVVEPPWKEWLEQNAGCDLNIPVEAIEYNIGIYCQKANFDPYDFWRSDKLYDNLQPISGSVEKLKTLSKYFDIVFVSRLKGQHHQSKVNFVKKHFTFMEGFIGTKEKYILNNSLVAMVDDRLDNLEGFDQNKRILYRTPYKQSIDIPVAGVIESWDSFSVEEFCDNYLE